MLKLSILDQSVMRQNSSPSQIIFETIEAARLAERLGFHRFWLSEHHNVPMMIGSTPEILMVKIADETRRIRIGSGGIMLPNYSSLKVAETFRMLEILFPNRIDLGIGNSSGGDQLTSLLLNPNNNFGREQYTKQIEDLQAFFNDKYTSNGSNIINAYPKSLTTPQQWILAGNPGGSSIVAAKYGLGLVLALSLKDRATPEIIYQYCKDFCPSEQFPKPQTILCVTVLCTETNEEAEQLRKESEYYQLRMEMGNFSPIGGQIEISESNISQESLDKVGKNYNHIITGNPEQIKKELIRLTEEFCANEIMINTMIYSHQTRLKSYCLLSKIFNLNGN